MVNKSLIFVFNSYFANLTCASRNCFSVSVVRNTLMLLSKCWLWYGKFPVDRFIVTVNVSFTLNRCVCQIFSICTLMPQLIQNHFSMTSFHLQTYLFPLYSFAWCAKLCVPYCKIVGLLFDLFLKSSFQKGRHWQNSGWISSSPRVLDSRMELLLLRRAR